MVKDTRAPDSSYILSRSQPARRATLSWRITPRLRRLWWCFLPKAPITRFNAPSSLIFMRTIRPSAASDRALHGLPHPTTRVHAKFTRQHVQHCSPLYCTSHTAIPLFLYHSSSSLRVSGRNFQTRYSLTPDISNYTSHPIIQFNM